MMSSSIFMGNVVDHLSKLLTSQAYAELRAGIPALVSLPPTLYQYACCLMQHTSGDRLALQA